MKSVRFVSVMAVVILTTAALHAAEAADPPGMSADAPWLKEQWPQARALVWARPGTGDSPLTRSNWTEYPSAADYAAGKQGRPASSPPDANTDLVLPDAPDGQSYIVGFFDGGRRHDAYNDPPRLFCRHITIGTGAGLDGGAGSSRGRTVFSSHPNLDAALEIRGNVTVKDGGYIYGQFVFAGGRHTFFRIDNSPEPLGTDLTVRKAGNASVTLLARRLDLAMGVTVDSGRLVLSPASHLRFGATRDARVSLGKMRENRMQEIAKADIRESYVYVRKGAALEMQAGSSIGRVKVPDNPVADLRIEGLLQIGKGEPAVIELGMAKGDGRFLSQHGGLYIRPTAEVRNFGKLSITAYNGDANDAAADTGVSIFLEKAVDLGDVSIDYLRAGGVVAWDPQAARASLAKATFGPHCAAKGAALFSRLDLVDFQGGMGTVEFVDGLTTDCRILFPHAGRLMLRSKGNRTAQSFDLKSVCAVTIDGRRTEFNAKRPLTAQEQEFRKPNALWGDVPGEGQVGNYASQQWDEARLLIWRRPGETGSRFVGPNWLGARGIPLFESPMDVDPDIDILLPAARDAYSVTGYGPGGMSRPVPTRHVTIEYNAEYGSSFDVRGNMWMKHGSGIRGRQLGCFNNEEPNVHRFMRFDGKRLNKGGRRDAPPFVDSEDYTTSQWGSYQTGKDSTLEVIGKIRGAADHSRAHGAGTLIMSENSFLTEGERSAFSIVPGATVVLLQDARIGHETTMQQDICKASVWVAGTLMIGLPERPITRDMLFPVAGVTKGHISRDPAEGGRTAGVSFLLGKQGHMVIHSADPAKARVIFKLHDSEKAKARGKRYGNPQGIALYFAGKAELNGVVFDNCYEGGIMVSPETRATWKNVFYGEHNLAEADKLYWSLGE